MLESMKKLSLIYLWDELKNSPDESMPEDLFAWFVNLKGIDAGSLFPFLVEPNENIERFYWLSSDNSDNDTAVLTGADINSLNGSHALKLPFNKPSGSQSAQIGPVIKRSYQKVKGGGPSIKILDSTLKLFKDIHVQESKWSPYFKEVLDVFQRPKLYFNGHVLNDEKNALALAVKHMPSKPTPCFLTFRDKHGRLPGEVPEYRDYLATMLEADEKYATKESPGIDGISCPLCERDGIKCYPSACSAAGINIFNIDREGAFTELKLENSWKSYSICADCADLLYIFKNRLVNDFKILVAGDASLVLPDIQLKEERRHRFYDKFKVYLDGINKSPQKSIVLEKGKLIRLLAHQNSISTIDIISVEFGQKLKKVTSRITEILPSRLREIHEISERFSNKRKCFYPDYVLENFRFNLNCDFLGELLRRPGGKKAKQTNASRNLFKMKRHVVECIYKKKPLLMKRFYDEMMLTAKSCFLHLAQEGDKPHLKCLNEGYSPKNNSTWMTLAGWIKHWAMTMDYLTTMEVIEPMDNRRTFESEMPELKPYFTENDGLNSDEKSFAFILGVLFGRVVQIQGAKGVNVSANALTWLKRLTLSGRDLPELYVKIREKLLAYDAEGSETVRNLLFEAGRLGHQLGSHINLNQIDSCFFLLLGQSLAVKFFPKKEKESQEEEL